MRMLTIATVALLAAVQPAAAQSDADWARMSYQEQRAYRQQMARELGAMLGQITAAAMAADAENRRRHPRQADNDDASFEAATSMMDMLRGGIGVMSGE